MTQNHKNSLRGLALALIVAAQVGLVPDNAKADSRFQKWIADFYQTAAQSGISKATYQKAFSGVSEPDPTVLEKAAYQPEFTSKIWDYVDSRVNPYTVKIGREMAAKHARTLAAIEQRFGVDKTILLAIWSMESNYGAVLDKDDRLHYVPRALATLAYADPSRAKFAKKQLVAALKILQNGDVPAREMTGSWAGAMVLLAVVLVLTMFGSRWLGFNKADQITITFCGSKKSLASGVPMANVIFAGQSIGAIVLPLMLFHQIQLMVCAVIAQKYAAAAARRATDKEIDEATSPA